MEFFQRTLLFCGTITWCTTLDSFPGVYWANVTQLASNYIKSIVIDVTWNRAHDLKCSKSWMYFYSLLSSFLLSEWCKIVIIKKSQISVNVVNSFCFFFRLISPNEMDCSYSIARETLLRPRSELVLNTLCKTETNIFTIQNWIQLSILLRLVLIIFWEGKSAVGETPVIRKNFNKVCVHTFA